MRRIKLTGRELSIVRAIGFGEGLLGAEIEEVTHMDADDLLDTLNGLMSAGFLESVPFYDQVERAAMSGTRFEMNPAYSQDLKTAMYAR